MLGRTSSRATYVLQVQVVHVTERVQVVDDCDALEVESKDAQLHQSRRPGQQTYCHRKGVRAEPQQRRR